MLLSRQAVAVLVQMWPISERPGLVFPSPYCSTKQLSENTFNSAMVSMGYKYLATAFGPCSLPWRMRQAGAPM